MEVILNQSEGQVKRIAFQEGDGSTAGDYVKIYDGHVVAHEFMSVIHFPEEQTDNGRNFYSFMIEVDGKGPFNFEYESILTTGLVSADAISDSKMTTDVKALIPTGTAEGVFSSVYATVFAGVKLRTPGNTRYGLVFPYDKDKITGDATLDYQEDGIVDTSGSTDVSAYLSNKMVTDYGLFNVYGADLTLFIGRYDETDTKVRVRIWKKQLTDDGDAV